MTVNRCACTRPSTTGSRRPRCRGDGCRAAVSSKEPPNLPSRLPDRQPFAEGARVKDTRFISTAPKLRPPKSLTDPEADARRPSSLTIGATAKVVLAIATLEGGLVLKILYKAGRRRAPGSHLLGPAAAAPPKSYAAAAASAFASTAPQCNARAPPKIARSHWSARGPKGPGTLRD